MDNFSFVLFNNWDQKFPSRKNLKNMCFRFYRKKDKKFLKFKKEATKILFIGTGEMAWG